jgi:hypothetical protein
MRALSWFVAQAEHEEDCNIRTRVTSGRGCSCPFGRCYARLVDLMSRQGT